jgi:hypothetical protein
MGSFFMRVVGYQNLHRLGPFDRIEAKDSPDSHRRPLMSQTQQSNRISSVHFSFVMGAYF